MHCATSARRSRGIASRRWWRKSRALTRPGLGRHAGRGRARGIGLRDLPPRALATDLVQQSVGAPQQGGPPAYRCRSASFPTATLLFGFGAVLAERQDEWLVAQHRYLSAESLSKLHVGPIDGETNEEVVPALAAAS